MKVMLTPEEGHFLAIVAGNPSKDWTDNKQFVSDEAWEVAEGLMDRSKINCDSSIQDLVKYFRKYCQ